MITAVLLGAALAMDAFSVSVANGLADGGIKAKKVAAIAGTFATFQFVMPMLGWLLVHTAIDYLNWFEKLVPWIALVLLSLIGLKMITDGISEMRAKDKGEEAAGKSGTGERLGAGLLIVQGVATSIDALSVGFASAAYDAAEALLSSLIIGAVTFLICAAGCLMGRRLGSVIGKYATIFGGLILIAIGIRIFMADIVL